MRVARRIVPVASFAVIVAACAAPKTAPPPPMGDLSGPWLLETDARPVRFVNDRGDTVSLTVSNEPLLLRQGAAVSDTSVAVEIAGLRVAGAMEITKGVSGPKDAELVTAGPSAGTLSFFAPVLSFEGRWGEASFSGEYRIDPKQAGKDVVILDAGRSFTLRRIGSGAR
jgi:hypothetical protein